MGDIFISYATEDRARIKPLVDALQERGWTVWWDRAILAGKVWEREIEAALTGARCVIVVWSEASVQSDWVWTEADEGRRRGILVPVLLDVVTVPLAFRKIQAANLVGWYGEMDNSEFEELATAVKLVLRSGAPPAAAVSATTETADRSKWKPRIAHIQAEPAPPSSVAKVSAQGPSEASSDAPASAVSKLRDTPDKRSITFQYPRATQDASTAPVPGLLWRRAVQFGARSKRLFRTVLFAGALLPFLFSLYREVTHSAVIIDSFSVPAKFNEAGLTSAVFGSRISDAMRQILSTTLTRRREDGLFSLQTEEAMPDVEFSGGTNVLQASVETIRRIFGIYPERISGDIVTEATSWKNEPKATVTFYITRGEYRSEANVILAPTLDGTSLARLIAESVLEQTSPYLLAVYEKDRSNYQAALKIIKRVLQDPSSDSHLKRAVLTLWGVAARIR